MKFRAVLPILFGFTAGLAIQPVARAQEAISRIVVSNGGGEVAASRFRMLVTVGQSVAEDSDFSSRLQVGGIWVLRDQLPRIVSLAPVAARAGDDVRVTVRLNHAAGIAAGVCTFTFDPSVLSPTTTEPGDLVPGASSVFVPNITTSGVIAVGWAGAGGLPSGEGTIFTAAFTVAADAPDGDTPLNFTGVTMYRADGVPVLVVTQDGSVTIYSSQMGDVNADGVITQDDVLLVFAFILGLQTATSEQQVAADVNANGAIDAGDATLIFQFATGVITTFPQSTVTKPVIVATHVPQLEGHVQSDGALALVLTLVPPEGTAGGDLHLTYDPTAGTPLQVHLEGLSAQALTSFNTETPGQIHVSFAQSPSMPAGNPIALRLVFPNRTNSPEWPVGLTGRLYNDLGLPLAAPALDHTLAPPPSEYILLQNHPNPFNPTTAISYALPEGGRTLLAVYSLTGQRVRVLWDGWVAAGWHSKVWDGLDDQGRRVGSGVYLYRIAVDRDRFTHVRRMVLMK